ncbi:MAG: trimethylamine methyltransferase family protein [Rhodospirillaceae bacterium]|nr:trimethylamine methyltransferase family protein [Rhodospirillaceae bacterium]
MARRERRINRQQRSAGLAQRPFRKLRNPYPKLEILSADQVEAIHQASLRVLRDTGMNFLLPKAVEILRQAGADIDTDGIRVRFDPALIEEKIKTVPPRFDLHARNPAHTVSIGDDWTVFMLMGSAPNVTDIDRGRRSGNYADFLNLIKLGQALNICHTIGGYPVEPVDLPASTRHLDAVAAMVRHTDKVLYGYALGRERMADGIEMARIARGISHERLLHEPSTMTVVNTNSPLQLDRPMLEGMIEMARANQPVILTPFTLAGAMAPITIAGALVEQNAEALAGIAFSQIVNPGAPIVYGSFTSNVDMRSGAPAFGTPEFAKSLLASGQLARRYGFPWRGSNVNASCAADEQATYESMMSIWPCMLAHCHMVKHSFGWLEGGLACSYEKIILDAEMLQMMAAFFEPLETDEDSLAVTAIDEVGPGKHFFQSPHTMARYEGAFYAPLLSDWRNFETWRESGSVEATQRANRIWKTLLETYEQPPLDLAILEELEAFVARRKEEGGAPPL